MPSRAEEESEKDEAFWNVAPTSWRASTHIHRCCSCEGGHSWVERIAQCDLESVSPFWEFPRWLSGKESAYQCRRCRRRKFDPWVGKIPWRRKWQPTLVFLPGKSHGQRSLTGYSLQGRKELDTTVWLNNNNSVSKIIAFNIQAFPGGSDGKESACNAGGLGSIPGSGRSPGEGNGNPLQCSCLENPMDRRAWWAAVHGVTKSWIQLSTHTGRPFWKQRQFCLGP